jgi:hypothetical protein
VRICELPITAEKVLSAIKAAGRGNASSKQAKESAVIID